MPWAKSFCPLPLLYPSASDFQFRYAPVTVGAGRVGQNMRNLSSIYKCLSPHGHGSRVAFSERIWRLWERNRNSWERKRETSLLIKGHFCALRRGTIVPQVGILSVSVLKKNQWRKYPSPFIFPLKSPVFIGVPEGEGSKSTLHHPSSPFIIFKNFLQIWR